MLTKKGRREHTQSNTMKADTNVGVAEFFVGQMDV